MKNQNLNGLEEDLKQGLEYNRKHGGVSDELRKMMRRPSGKVIVKIDQNNYSKNWEKIKWQTK
jgi:hypothetical protein